MATAARHAEAISRREPLTDMPAGRGTERGVTNCTRAQNGKADSILIVHGQEMGREIQIPFEPTGNLFC